MLSANNYPSPDNCKTKLVMDDLWYCVTKTAFRCHHVIRLGSEYYCDHPDRHTFKRTDKNEMAR